MATLDELKNTWQQHENASAETTGYSQTDFSKIIQRRVRKHTSSAFQYFWAAFVLQIIVYALCGHVIVKYAQNSLILSMAIAGILLYIPFTVVLLKKFKKLAIEKPTQQSAGTSVRDYVHRQQALLRSFYQFKKAYELFLIPFGCAIGVALVFELYVPGGVHDYWRAAVLIFFVSLASCMAAIYAENKKSFIRPLQQLQTIVDEFEQED